MSNFVKESVRGARTFGWRRRVKIGNRDHKEKCMIGIATMKYTMLIVQNNLNKQKLISFDHPRFRNRFL